MLQRLCGWFEQSCHLGSLPGNALHATPSAESHSTLRVGGRGWTSEARKSRVFYLPELARFSPCRPEDKVTRMARPRSQQRAAALAVDALHSCKSKVLGDVAQANARALLPAGGEAFACCGWQGWRPRLLPVRCAGRISRASSSGSAYRTLFAPILVVRTALRCACERASTLPNGAMTFRSCQLLAAQLSRSTCAPSIAMQTRHCQDMAQGAEPARVRLYRARACLLVHTDAGACPQYAVNGPRAPPLTYFV